VTNIVTGPDGDLYVTSLTNGAVYRIHNQNVRGAGNVRGDSPIREDGSPLLPINPAPPGAPATSPAKDEFALPNSSLEPTALGTMTVPVMLPSAAKMPVPLDAAAAGRSLAAVRKAQQPTSFTGDRARVEGVGENANQDVVSGDLGPEGLA
jgi:hypothetical protein